MIDAFIVQHTDIGRAESVQRASQSYRLDDTGMCRVRLRIGAQQEGWAERVADMPYAEWMHNGCTMQWARRAHVTGKGGTYRGGMDTVERDEDDPESPTRSLRRASDLRIHAGSECMQGSELDEGLN